MFTARSYTCLTGIFGKMCIFLILVYLHDCINQIQLLEPCLAKVQFLEKTQKLNKNTFKILNSCSLFLVLLASKLLTNCFFKSAVWQAQSDISFEALSSLKDGIYWLFTLSHSNTLLTIDIQEVCFCPQIASISQGGQSHRRTAVSYKLEWLVKNK